MKKLKIFCLFLLTACVGYSQGVKISAMPTLSDSASIANSYFPVIHNDPPYTNYKVLGSSLALLFPSSGGTVIRFAYPGEDDNNADGENRIFTIANFSRFQLVSSDNPQSNFYFDYRTAKMWNESNTNSRSYFQSYSADPVNTSTVYARKDSRISSIAVYADDTRNDITLAVSSGGTVNITGIANTTTANVLYYDNVTGNTTWGAAPSGGGGGSITADNGLNMSTSTNAQLGGPLVQTSTTITADATHNVYFTSAATVNNQYALFVQNTSTGSGLSASAGNGLAINAVTTGTGVAVNAANTVAGGKAILATATGSNSYGVQAQATNGATALYGGVASGTSNYAVAAVYTAATTPGFGALYAQSNLGIPVHIAQLNGTEGSTVQTMIKIRRTTQNVGTQAVAGIGGSIDFWLPSWNGTSNVDTHVGTIISKLTNAATATMTSQLIFQGKNNGGAVTDWVTMDGGGNVKLSVAGKALGLKSPDGTQWYVTISNAGTLSTSTTAP